MAETNQFNIEVGVDTKDSISKLKELSSTLADVAGSVKGSTSKMSGSFNTMSTNVSSSLSLIGKALVFGSFGAFIKSALQTSAQLEQTAISFEVFTGSAEVANRMLGELKDQALKSPMQFQDITNGAKTLLGYGLTAEQVIPITRMLGDISGGNADKFARLSLAFGQVNAAGRLMGQEARQMINAGFNPLQAISDKTGVSMAVLTKRMHDGQISVKEVGDAFVYATSEGGRYYGMADRQSQTLQGQFNKLSESVTFAMAEIGTSISENLQLGDVITHVSVLVDKLKNSFLGLNQGTNNAAEFNRLLKGTLDVLAIGIDLCIKAWGLLTLGLGELLKLSQPVINFFDTLDAAIIKDTKNIPYLGTALKTVIDYFNEFGKTEPVSKSVTQSITDLEKKVASLEQNKILFQWGSIGYKQIESDIEKYKKDISILKLNSGWSLKIPGLSDKPSGAEDSQTKGEKTKIQKLIQANKDAIAEIAMIWMSATDKKLADLKLKYDQEIRDYVKYKLDYSNITKKYEVEKAKILDDANKKREADNIKAHATELAGLDEFYKRTEEKERQRIATAIKNHQEEVAALQMEYPKFSGDFATDALNTDLASNLKTYGEAFYAATKDFAINMSTGFAEIASTAMMGGLSLEDTFKSLGSMILSSLGDYLIKIGTAAIAAGTVGTILKTFFTGGAATVPELGIAGGMAAVAVGSAMKALSGKVSDSMSKTKMPNSSGSTSSSVASRASGASYQYGGASYATQSVRLLVDLTGSITATQTGYSINKSLETTLRVTGR